MTFIPNTLIIVILVEKLVVSDAYENFRYLGNKNKIQF
jgi:hypothetical protein